MRNWLSRLRRPYMEMNTLIYWWPETSRPRDYLGNVTGKRCYRMRCPKLEVGDELQVCLTDNLFSHVAAIVGRVRICVREKGTPEQLIRAEARSDGN